MPSFPEMPPDLRSTFPPFFWNWWQAFRTYLLKGFFTETDITVLTKGKGIVLTNAAGTIQKRVRLNDLGTGLIFEDV